jgi:hypothetical protein
MGTWARLAGSCCLDQQINGKAERLLRGLTGPVADTTMGDTSGEGTSAR